MHTYARIPVRTFIRDFRAFSLQDLDITQSSHRTVVHFPLTLDSLVHHVWELKRLLLWYWFSPRLHLTRYCILIRSCLGPNLGTTWVRIFFIRKVVKFYVFIENTSCYNQYVRVDQRRTNQNKEVEVYRISLRRRGDQLSHNKSENVQRLCVLVGVGQTTIWLEQWEENGRLI